MSEAMRGRDRLLRDVKKVNEKIIELGDLPQTEEIKEKIETENNKLRAAHHMNDDLCEQIVREAGLL